MENFNNSSEYIKPIDKISYLQLELRVMLIHLVINIFCFILILLLPTMLASIIGVLTLSIYFFLGVYIRCNYDRKPSFFTIPIFYTLLSIAALILVVFINIYSGVGEGIVFAFSTSGILMPLYILLSVFGKYSFYIFNILIIPVIFLPAILMQLGYVNYSRVPNYSLKLINGINVIFTKWKITLLINVLLLLTYFPVSTINFSYKTETCAFGIYIYEYTVHSNRDFKEINRSFSGDTEKKVEGKLTYFDYMLLSGSKLLELPIEIMMDCRGYNPHVLSEGFTYKEIHWAWRKF